MDEQKIKEVYKTIDEVFSDEDFSNDVRTKTLLKRRIRKILM